MSGHGAGQAGFGVTVEFFQEEPSSADGGGLQTAQIKRLRGSWFLFLDPTTLPVRVV